MCIPFREKDESRFVTSFFYAQVIMKLKESLLAELVFFFGLNVVHVAKPSGLSVLKTVSLNFVY